MALTLGGAVVRKSGGVAVPNLFDEQFLGFGQAQVGWDTKDADANLLKVNLPGGGLVSVPVGAIGVGIRGVDLGFWNGRTQALFAVVDTDRDSWTGLGFTSDDIAELALGGAATELRFQGANVYRIIGTAADTIVHLTAGSGGDLNLQGNVPASRGWRAFVHDGSNTLTEFSHSTVGGVGNFVFYTYGTPAALTERLRILDTAKVRLSGDLELRNSTTATTLYTYHTFTDTSNYERSVIGWVTNTLEIGTQAAGTGSTRQLFFLVGGARTWGVNTSKHFLPAEDNVYDIGALGLNRIRNIYVGTNVIVTGKYQSSAGVDLALNSDTNIVNLVNSTTAQNLRVYSTFTDANNYERLNIHANAGNAFQILVAQAGTGTARALHIGTNGAASLSFATNGTLRFNVNSSGHLVAETDNAYDIGAVNATRPRNAYLGTNLFIGTKAIAAIGDASYNRIQVTATNDYAGLYGLSASNDGSKYAFIALAASRGSISSPSATQNNDVLGQVDFQGYSDSYNGGVARIEGKASATWAAGSLGAQLNFYTTTNGAPAGTLRWTMSNAGHLLAGTDNSWDIGASGANRPRNLYVAGSIYPGYAVLIAPGGYVGGIDGSVSATPFSFGAGGLFRDTGGRISITTNGSGATFQVHHSLGIECNANLNINDVNLVLGTATGTKIGTATSQKLAFYNATPVTQRTKASHNNWAALSDVVTALVELGLFDQA